ncbi:MAG: reverse transcriptase domain-containing protein, partial [Chloroflexota bacterium]
MTWDSFLTPDNFQLAWRRIRNSRIRDTKDRLGLKVFSQALDVHIEQLIIDIQSEKYEPESPSIIYSPKKSGRLRPFTLLSMRDHLLYQAIGNIVVRNAFDDLQITADINVFSPVLSDIESDYVFYPALQKGDKFEGQFVKFMRRQTELISLRHHHYVAEADIASFYPSIDHGLLGKKLVLNGWLNERISYLLSKCLNKWSSNNANFVISKGLPIGYEASDVLANLFIFDLDEFLKKFEYIRYVDDIRIFTTNKNEAESALIELDKYLLQQGLVLNANKSKVKDLRDLSIQKELTDLQNQQILLSDIQRQLNSNYNEQRRKADKELQNILVEVLNVEYWDNPNYEEDLKASDNETYLFFSLYRIREKNIKLRDLCLKLLITHPHRSYAIVKYLSLFKNDPDVLNELWKITRNNAIHSKVRADCLQGLYQLSANTEEIVKVVQEWILSEDLTLAFSAVGMIQRFKSQIDFLESCVEQISSEHLLLAVISTLYSLYENQEDKVLLINFCLNNDKYMLKSLGVFFVSTSLHLLPMLDDVLDDLVEKLLDHLRERISLDNSIINLQRLFGIDSSI